MTSMTSAIRPGAATPAAAALAAAADDPHVRGEVVAVDGGAVTVATATDQPAQVRMADDHTVLM